MKVRPSLGAAVAGAALLCGAPVVGSADGGAQLAFTPGAPAAARPERPDLRARDVPVRPHLAMRQTADGTSGGGGASAGPDATSSTTSSEPARTKMPTAPTASGLDDVGASEGSSWTGDLREKLIIKVNAGVELDSAQTSGKLQRGGRPLTDVTAQRPWVIGNAAVGTRDLVTPSLNAYMLAGFQFDMAPTTDASATPMWSDAEGQQIAIRAGYAEWGRDDRAASGLRRRLWIRAGRQFRLDGGLLGAYFDGVTVGLHGNTWDVAAYAGQRAALYVTSETGTVLGATASADLRDSQGWPVTIKGDWMSLLINGDSRFLVSGTADAELGKHITVTGRIRANDDGTGAVLGRAGARIRGIVGRKYVITGDLEHRSAGDLAFDLVAPNRVDVVDTSQTLGVGLSQPVATELVGLRADARFGNAELMAFGQVERTGTDAVRHDQTGYNELGAAVSNQVMRGVFVTAQYKFRGSVLVDAANEIGARFDDTGGSGSSSFQEVAAETIWRKRAGGGRDFRVGLGAYFRVYDIKTPYVDVSNDARAGGRVSISYWLSRSWRTEIGGDVAQTSPTMSRELSTITAARAAVEVKF